MSSPMGVPVHSMEISSWCPQLSLPHPLLSHEANVVSSPRQFTLSIHIGPVPRPYRWRTATPSRLHRHHIDICSRSCCSIEPEFHRRRSASFPCRGGAGFFFERVGQL